MSIPNALKSCSNTATTRSGTDTSRAFLIAFAYSIE